MLLTDWILWVKLMEQKTELKPCPFKSIPNFEGIYWITKNGDVINADGVTLKPYDNGYGYFMVDLKKNDVV